jgi:hypothetical protein
MVSDPESCLREICGFLEEEFTVAMLSMEGAIDFRNQLGKSEDQNLLSMKYVGGYRENVPLDEIAFMQMFAGSQMRLYGYEIEQLNFPIWNNLKFWMIDCPLNLLRMAAWLLIETLQQNLPGLFGRSPSARLLLKDKLASG